MGQWWQSLTLINQVFYGAAIFFSVIFLWQLIAALMGLAGGEADVEVEAEADVDADVDDIEADSADAAESAAAFKLLSIRSVLAFFTMFCWAGAMYLNIKLSLTRSLSYALLWGLAGMVIVGLVVHLLRRLSETGTKRLATAVGTVGTVYMHIPDGAAGQVRVAVGGVSSYVAARGKGGRGIEAGQPIRVVRVVGPNILEVEPAEEPGNQKREGE